MQLWLRVDLFSTTECSEHHRDLSPQQGRSLTPSGTELYTTHIVRTGLTATRIRQGSSNYCGVVVIGLSLELRGEDLNYKYSEK